jgi:hypothetical protein
MQAAQEDDPELPEELAAIPVLGVAAEAILEALNALGNVGADMTKEVREQAQRTIVASVIVSQVATTAASAAASAAAASFRRNKQ